MKKNVIKISLDLLQELIDDVSLEKWEFLEKNAPLIYKRLEELQKGYGEPLS